MVMEPNARDTVIIPLFTLSSHYLRSYPRSPYQFTQNPTIDIFLSLLYLGKGGTIKRVKIPKLISDVFLKIIETLMKWNKKYVLGIAVIDAQHKQLFRLNDELEAGLQSGIRPEELSALLTRLGEYAVRHFILEEKHMSATEYPGLTEQQEAHRTFVARFAEIRDDFTRDGLTGTVINTLHRELIDWIREHITIMDQQFGKYYNERQ
jgi:hemerythrin